MDKAISLRAPWWWLVLHAGKDVENRHLGFSKRRGFTYLHASKWWSTSVVCETISVLVRIGLVDKLLGDSDLDRMRAMAGSIVGHMVVHDVVTYEAWGNESKFPGGDPVSPWAVPDSLCLRLRDCIALDEPIQYRGNQGYFNVDI